MSGPPGGTPHVRLQRRWLLVFTHALNGHRSREGVDDVVHVPDAGGLKFGTSDFTISLWLQSDWDKSVRQYLVHKRDGDHRYELQFLDGSLAFGIKDRKNGMSVRDRTTAFDDACWHHVVATVPVLSI